MLQADMIAMVRDFARNAQDSTMYPDARIVRAIDVAADAWQRIVKSPRALGTITLTAGSSALPNPPAGWLPERHMQATLLSPAGSVLNPSIDVVAHHDVLRRQYEYGSLTAQARPQCLGFLTNATSSTGIAFPTPDQAYPVLLWYWTLFDSTTPNLPDDHLRAICAWGAPSVLQQAEPENVARCAGMWESFVKMAREVKGRDAGGRTGNVAVKDDSERECRSFYPVG